MASNIYSLIEEKGFSDGMVFIALQDNTIINVTVYSGIIIFFKCLRLSFEQIVNALAKGNIKDITFQKSEVHFDTMQPDVIAESFPAAVAASALQPTRTDPSRLIRIVQIMSGLAKLDNARGSKAFDVVSRQISAQYPDFLPDTATIKKRISLLEDNFNIPTGFLSGKSLPTDTYSMPQWIFTHFDAISNNDMKEAALYFIFFGEVPKKVITTVIEQDASLGSRQGSALLSNVVYPDLQNSSTALIFKGATAVGETKIDWRADKKNTIVMPRTDLDKFGLKSGEKVTFILIE